MRSHRAWLWIVGVVVFRLNPGVWPEAQYEFILLGMKRATYTLDEPTVERVNALASRWNVSRSEAIRRAVATASAGPNRDGLSALRALQSRIGLTEKRATDWARQVARERRAWRP
jgi:hypothetical protein